MVDTLPELVTSSVCFDVKQFNVVNNKWRPHAYAPET